MNPAASSAGDTPLSVFSGSPSLAELTNSGTAYVVIVRSGAELTPGALDAIGHALERFPDAELLYGDDDTAARPDFSPVRLRSHDYLGDVVVVRRDILSSGAAAPAVEPLLLPWALALEVAARNGRVVHIPEALSQGGERVRPDPAAVTRLIRGHLDRIGVPAEVVVRADGTADIRYTVDGSPLVSIVIPTRGGSGLLRGSEHVFVLDALTSVIERSTYRELEFVVVADEETPAEVLDQLVRLCGERLHLVTWSAPFNFAAKMNRGAAVARGEYLLLLNDDVELISPDWIERMLGLAQQPGVGAVGPLLSFEDGTVQHGGHVYRAGEPSHIALGLPADWDDAIESMRVDREVSGVTAACALVSAADFRSVGGFSTLLPSNYNDVDLCMKLRSRGLDIVWTPHAHLYHFESRTRIANIVPYERDALLRRWASRIQLDPYWPEG